jgi:geranylgeranyl reductase family protein
MDTCDAIVVGGGPAGSACARQLHRAGFDVVVIDRAVFPRDKVCAGWITPQVIDALDLDCEDYRRGRTFQPITGFRVGLLGSTRDVDTQYDRAVSFGIRRCEFDHYLLNRSGARLRLGAEIVSWRRDNELWVVNEAIAAPVLVGAGGHFCPVAKRLNPVHARSALVAAQEAEFPLDSESASDWNVSAETPQLYFCRDMKGYGWCFRKGGYLNVGLGRLDGGSLTSARAAFVTFLEMRRIIPAARPMLWRGHAYLVAQPPRRAVVDDGLLLAGDAAGLAYAESGEGIRPAIESGLLAASTIVDAGGQYTRDRLEPYERSLRARFGHADRRPLSRAIPPAVTGPLFPRLLATPWFVRHMVLDRWFLHAGEPALVPLS